MRQSIPGRLLALVLLGAMAGPASVLAQSAPDSTATLTLDAALAEARKANAELPVANLRVRAALARVQEAHGALYPMLSVGGDVHGGAPVAYASGDAFLGVVARASLYEGGELRAAEERSNAEAEVLRAGYRVAVRDVDYAVRTGYDRALHARDSRAFLKRGIERLRAYLSVVQARQAAGQGVGADVLRTQQRLASSEADVASLTRELHAAKMQLNDVLGRIPDAPLHLASLPTPASPTATGGQPWLATPDVAQTRSDVRAAEAGVRAARAGRKLHVDLEADAGGQPVLNSTQSLLNNGTGWGTEVTLSFSLPFWDHGIYRGRMAEAGAALDEAHKQQIVVRRAARLAWSRAAQAVGDLYREYEARSRAADVARDAYLQAESVYRGGQGTALNVLDAYDAWVQAEQDRLNVIYDYRVAEAELYRWGNS